MTDLCFVGERTRQSYIGNFGGGGGTDILLPVIGCFLRVVPDWGILSKDLRLNGNNMYYFVRVGSRPGHVVYASR